MGRRLGLSLLALGSCVALLLAPAFASPSGESRPGGTLRLMWGQAPDSVDTALANGDVGSWLLLSATCSTLFTTVHDPATGTPRIVPEVAMDFPEISNRGHTYTFELKRTFRFHTGAGVTAQSCVEAFNRDAAMRSPVLSRGSMQDVIGADAGIQGQAREISGVQALGRYRLRIRLKRRAVDFVSRLTMPYFCPIAPGTQRAVFDPLRRSWPTKSLSDCSSTGTRHTRASRSVIVIGASRARVATSSNVWTSNRFGRLSNAAGASVARPRADGGARDAAQEESPASGVHRA